MVKLLDNLIGQCKRHREYKCPEGRDHVSCSLLCPHPENNTWHVISTQLIFINETKVENDQPFCNLTTQREVWI